MFKHQIKRSHVGVAAMAFVCGVLFTKGIDSISSNEHAAVASIDPIHHAEAEAAHSIKTYNFALGRDVFVQNTAALTAEEGLMLIPDLPEVRITYLLSLQAGNPTYQAVQAARERMAEIVLKDYQGSTKELMERNQNSHRF
ncbi:hypothetical protein D3C87_703090 [compost metagenome]